MLIDKVIEIVKNAASLIHYDSFEINSKGSNVNMVTTEDLNVQKYLYKELLALLPASSFYGEENNTECLESKEYQWIVDPIDGTCNFTRNINEWAISVGLVHNNEPILGVIYLPKTDDLYYASLGNGSYHNGTRIEVSNKPFKEGLLCTAMSLYKKEYSDTCFNIIRDAYAKCNDIRRFGACSVELCYLAEGKCDLYFEFRLFPWDYCAGLIILKEAGGYYSGIDNKVYFNRPMPLICANSLGNLDKLKEIVNKYLTTIPYDD